MKKNFRVDAHEIYTGICRICLFICVLDIGFKVSVSVMEKVIKLVHLEIEIQSDYYRAPVNPGTRKSLRGPS